MRIRPHCIPGAENIPVEVHVIETVPGEIRLALSADEFGITRGPLRRGNGPPYFLRKTSGKMRRVTSQAMLRQDLKPVAGSHKSHLSLFGLLHADRVPVAVTGCGNLGLNPGTLAADPNGRLGARGPFGGIIEVLEDGSGRGVDDFPNQPENFALSGPVLVRGGEPCKPDALTFPDPRHLLLFPYVEVRPDLWVDFGHDVLLNHKKVPLYQRAVDGEAISLSLMMKLPVDDTPDEELEEMAIREEDLRLALTKKGYDEPFDIAEGTAQITFRPGLYSHHVLAVRENGVVCSVLVSGASNRAGVRIVELAEDLAEGGFQDAILLDNGGDVGIFLPEEQRFALRPREKDRAQNWPLSACLIYWREA